MDQLRLFSLSRLSSPNSIDNKMWSDDETVVLIDIWGSDEIQQKLATIKRNRLVWEEVSRKMGARGIHRSAKQCCGKIHNLKVEFRKVKTMKKENNFKFFDLMDPLMVGDVTLAAELSEASNYRSPASGVIAVTRSRQDASDFSNSSLGAEGDDGQDHNHDSSSVAFAPIGRTPGAPFQHPQFCTAENDGVLRLVKVENENSNENEGDTKAAPTVDGPVGVEESTPAHTTGSFADTNTAPGPSTDRVNHPRKRRRYCEGADLEVLFEKLRQMQEESDKRFYEWEERRLRLEHEFEERRQRLESERESRRERFLIQLVSVLANKERATDLMTDPNRPTPPTAVSTPRTQTVITTSTIGTKRVRNGEAVGPGGIRSANGCL